MKQVMKWILPLMLLAAAGIVVFNAPEKRAAEPLSLDGVCGLFWKVTAQEVEDRFTFDLRQTAEAEVWNLTAVLYYGEQKELIDIESKKVSRSDWESIEAILRQSEWSTKDESVDRGDIKSEFDLRYASGALLESNAPTVEIAAALYEVLASLAAGK